MNDMDALERTFEQIRKLPPEERERVRLLLDDMLAEPNDAAAFEREMQDPEYRAYVEQALEESAADVAAGRTYPLEEVFDRVIGDFKKRHGL